MATQYTAGIVPGQKWTAAIANQIGAAWETWTPVVKQGTTTFGVTVNSAKYCRIQKLVIANAGITIASGTGQAAQPVTMSYPINHLWVGFQVTGSAWIYDNSAATAYAAIANGNAADAASFFGDWSGGTTWGNTPNIQFTTGDQIRAYFVYEAQ